MTYRIKEVFYTLQGEGRQCGRPAVFVRFSGCNLWSGREKDRERAICRFCDTDFVGTDGVNGGVYTAAELLEQVTRLWPQGRGRPFIVCTGGEPVLQLDDALLDAFHRGGFEVAVETNGTLPVPDAVDWICVSPKAGAPLRQTSGNELKLVYPQDGQNPSGFLRLDFDHFYLQPKDGSGGARARHTDLAVSYCLEHPEWTLSLQTHKWSGIP